MNKRIIRVIIYEGDEELVDKYEKYSFNHTQFTRGHPKYWNGDQVTGSMYITGITLDVENGIFQAIDKHNQEILRQNNIPSKQIPLQDLVTNFINKINYINNNK